MSFERTKWPRGIRSLRVRLVLLSVTMFAATLVLFSVLLYFSFMKGQKEDFDVSLFNHAVDVSQNIDFSIFGDLSVRQQIVSEREKIFPFAIGNALVQIRSINGAVLARSRSLGDYSLPFEPADRTALFKERAGFKTIIAFGQHFRQINFRVDRPGVPRMILQIGVPLAMLESTEKGLIVFLLTSVPLMLLVAMLGGLYLSRHALNPVRAMIQKTQEIGVRALGERVPVPQGDDELKQLALTLNGLLQRLQQAFEGQERFIADASHQLKTPLAILRGELDLVLAPGTARSEKEIREFLQSASSEIDYLSRMVEDLLMLARVDAGTEAMVFQRLRLDESMLEVVSRLEPFARKKGINIKLDLEPLAEGEASFELNGDPELLQCLFRNLIENAIKYSGSGTRVDVLLRDGKDEITVRVRDQGPGIEAASRARIFERFYRAGSGEQKVPGMGLGLPIAQRIAQAHGGRIEVAETGPGATFMASIRKS